MPCWYYEKEDLESTPSVKDGIDQGTEARYRREGARFIIEAGTAQGLRYDTMATGVVYFHRFYMFHSFKEFPRYVMGAACLFLAGKVEETPKKCKDIIKIAKNILPEQHFTAFGEDPKEEIMTHERILLQTIKFDLQVEHPYSYLLKYAKTFKGDKDKIQKLVQMAWTFVNDSLCTTLCLQWEPHIVAVGFLYLAGRLSKSDLMDWSGKQTKAKWWEQLTEDISLDIMEEICHKLLDLYAAGQKKGQPGTPPKAGAAPQKRPKVKTEGEGEHGDPKAKSVKQEHSREKQRPPPPPPPATHASQLPASHTGHQSAGAPPAPPHTQPASHTAPAVHSQLEPSAKTPHAPRKTLLELPLSAHQVLPSQPPHKVPQQTPHQVPHPVPHPTQQQPAPPVPAPPVPAPAPAPPPHAAPHQAPLSAVQQPAAHPTIHPAPHPAPHHIPHPAPPAQAPQTVQHHQPPVMAHPQPSQQAQLPRAPPTPEMHQPPYQQVPGFPPQKPPVSTYAAPHYTTQVFSSVAPAAPQPGLPLPSQALPAAPTAQIPAHPVHPHHQLPGQVANRPPAPSTVPPPYARPPPATTQPLQYHLPPPPAQAGAPAHQMIYRPPPPASVQPSASSVPQYATCPPAPTQAPPPAVPAHYPPPAVPAQTPPPTTQYRPHTPPVSHPQSQQHLPLIRSQPPETGGTTFAGAPRNASPAPPRGMVPNFPPPPTTASQPLPSKLPPSQSLPADLNQVDESMLNIAKKYAAQQLQNLGMPRNIALQQVPGTGGQQQQPPPGLSAQAPGAAGQAAQGGFSTGLATVRITGREMGRRPSHGTNKRR